MGFLPSLHIMIDSIICKNVVVSGMPWCMWDFYIAYQSCLNCDKVLGVVVIEVQNSAGWDWLFYLIFGNVSEHTAVWKG